LIDTGGTNAASVSAGGALLVTGTGGTFPVTGTFWQATQPVSGTFWQTTQPVSGTVTANAGTGTFGTNVAQFGGTAVTLGQAVMASSMPVVIASNQGAIPVTISASSPGTPVCDYATETSIAVGSAGTHTYTTPTGKTFSLGKVYVSASGKIKVTVTANSVQLYTGWTSVANPTVGFDLGEFTQPVGSTLTTVVSLTNEDIGAMDVYSSIVGSYQ
jgi:hypothetical protein